MEVIRHPQTSSTEPSSTCLLLSLPPELLLAIFSFIGVKNFLQDVRRLAVCKEWYAYARPILLGHLQLCTTDLLPMLRAMRTEATLAAAQKMTKHIHLRIFTRPASTYCLVSLLKWLAGRLKDFAALRTLVVRSREFLPIFSIQVFSSLLTIHQLTSLEVYLEDVYFAQDGVHLCDSISRSIPTLKSLRCRLPRMCNSLLESPPGDLEELVLVIFRTNGDPSDTEHCSTGSTLNDDRHRAVLEARLVQFAASMRNPKTVRLVHRFQNRHKTYAFDAIKKRRFSLGFCPDWDADGVLLPEDWDKNQESEEDQESEQESEEDQVSVEDQESEEGQESEEDEE